MTNKQIVSREWFLLFPVVRGANKRQRGNIREGRLLYNPITTYIGTWVVVMAARDGNVCENQW